MKKRFAFILIFVSSLQVTYAQDDHMPVKGYNKNRVFIGTSINLGL